MLIKIIKGLDCCRLITIEYLGESEDGKVCKKCGGRPVAIHTTRKKIFGRLWEVGKPQNVSLDEFDLFMATGLFQKTGR
ncbi:hypothetical protein [Enterococcus thailandicus]|uniref:hypothetical protein n=1 Tax=Enterococcus thailandicus TaxID=417368 RepID=UPI0035DFFFD4